ncbi:MAG: TonB family protein [Gammaproteobacteria bacterium]
MAHKQTVYTGLKHLAASAAAWALLTTAQAQIAPEAATETPDPAADSAVSDTGYPASATSEDSEEPSDGSEDGVATDEVVLTPDQQLDAAQQRFLRLFDAGSYRASMAAAAEVVELSESINGTYSIDTARALTNLGNAQQQAGETELAQASYKRSITITEEVDDVLAEELVNPLMGLASLYNSVGRYDLGMETYRRALLINHASLGFYNPEQNRIKDGLTESFMGLGEIKDADFQQLSQVESLERQHGYNSPMVVPARYKLAEWYRRTNQHEKETEQYLRASNAMRAVRAEQIEEYVESQRQLAGVYRRAGLFSTSLRTLNQALKFLNKQTDVDPLLRGELLVQLGDTYNAYDSASDAVILYTDAWNALSGANLLEDTRQMLLGEPNRIVSYPAPDIYPRRRSKDIDPERNPESFGDGLILVRYTVNAQGRVKNAEIIESDPADMLDRKVLSAVRRSLYRPQFENGQPVAVDNIVYRHPFKFEKSREKKQRSNDDDEKLPNPFTQEPDEDAPT